MDSPVIFKDFVNVKKLITSIISLVVKNFFKRYFFLSLAKTSEDKCLALFINGVFTIAGVIALTTILSLANSTAKAFTADKIPS